MAEVALALWWHQHQPYYPDDVSGQCAMPWVRLHGVKDYYGMALHLDEFPEVHCAINLVPSLLVQLEGYTDRQASDRFLDVSRLPADGLDEESALFLVENFFMASPEHMIRPFPRYAELYLRRGPAGADMKMSLRRFQARDFRDLQVWFNLAWIHPIAFERDGELRELRDKGRGFSEADKERVLAKQLEILRAIVPLHRELAQRGQIELTTTPFYHPILPLLFDRRLARESIPDAKLPRCVGGYPDDAGIHVSRALALHERVFGKRPRGMWPAEGSVCQSMLPVLADQGIGWIGTDEEILSRSTQGAISRDSRGHVRNALGLYRPYRLEEDGRSLAILFRDHALSDLIGFHYQRTEPQAAAQDFIDHLRSIGQIGDRGEVPLVSVILDGENCWEHYPGGGVGFLRGLYEKLSQGKDIRTVCPGVLLEANPPRDTLARLFPGSWINHNFAIWIGHEEDNAAWDALDRTREHLERRLKELKATREPLTGTLKAANNVDAERLRRAWEELYIAEGSDWFWWYGDDHSSAQDALFDFLFRQHLQNVYRLLGDSPPADLARPISRRAQRIIHTLPRALLEVQVDGRATFFEWIGAGRYVHHNERGTMAQTSPGPLRELNFGFNDAHFLLRIDFQTPAVAAMAELSEIRVCFVEPADWILTLRMTQSKALQSTLTNPRGLAVPGLKAAIDRIIELALPLTHLGLQEGETLQFFVEAWSGAQSRDRAPAEGTICLTCPGADFDRQMWSV